MSDENSIVAQQVVWIYHDRLYHAFVFDDPPAFPMKSACGYHKIDTGRRPAIGAAKCIECAVALGDEFPRPDRIRWASNGPQKMGCRFCNQSTPPDPHTVGTTSSGLWAPQSAIDSMRTKGKA